MKINSCSVKFYLDQTRARHDGYPIFCRIIIARKKAEFKVGYYCHTKDWDDALGMPTPKAQDALIKHGEIARIQSAINNALNDANRADKVLSAADIKSLVTGDGTKRYTLLSLGEEVIANYEKTQQAPMHLEKIKNTMWYVKVYLEQERKLDLPIESVNLQFLKNFEAFMKVVRVGRYAKTLSINTVGKHMSRLRTVCKYATDSEIISKNIFTGYRIPQVRVRRKSLTLEEFQRMRDLDLSQFPEKERVRDAFIFCCYTGVRFADSQGVIKMENIRFDKSLKTHFLTFVQDKNKHNIGLPIHVPLLPQAMKIIEKYNETNFRQIEGRILPPTTNQHANRILKSLARLAKVSDQKLLTFHLSRHTCAQLQYEAEILERTTGAWLGQFSNSITSVYQNDYERTLAKAAVKFEAYLNN
jgi:integrase